MNKSNGPGVSYELEIEAEVTTVFDDEKQAQHAFLPSGTKIITIETFYSNYRSYFEGEDGEYKAKQFWCQVLGNFDEKNRRGDNPFVNSLTKSACDMLVAHMDKVKLGINLEGFPDRIAHGFVLIVNPDDENRCSLLDYSPSYSKNVKPHPLQQELDEEIKESSDEFSLNLFSKKAQKLYESLDSKKNGYCSSLKLYHAFSEFVRLVEDKNLSFEKVDFNPRSEPFDPILLLAHWEKILTNPHLKKEDLQSQWEELFQLDVYASRGPIRALTDYQFSNRPMTYFGNQAKREFNLSSHKQECGYRDTPEEIERVNAEKRPLSENQKLGTKITDKETFWRYIEYQSKRKSIEFYKKALEILDKQADSFVLDEEGRVFNLYDRMLHLLAIGSSGENYDNNDEEITLKEWEEIVSITARYKNISSESVGVALLHLRESGQNLKFTKHLSEYYLHYVKNMALREGVTGSIYDIDVWPADNPYSKTQHHRGISPQGDRFNETNDPSLSWDDYLTLQADLNPILARVFSTFQIHNTQEITQLNARLNEHHLDIVFDIIPCYENQLCLKEHYLLLDYVLSLFDDVSSNQNLTYHDLIAIFNKILDVSCSAHLLDPTCSRAIYNVGDSDYTKKPKKYQAEEVVDLLRGEEGVIVQGSGRYNEYLLSYYDKKGALKKEVTVSKGIHPDTTSGFLTDLRFGYQKAARAQDTFITTMIRAPLVETTGLVSEELKNKVRDLKQVLIVYGKEEQNSSLCFYNQDGQYIELALTADVLAPFLVGEKVIEDKLKNDWGAARRALEKKYTLNEAQNILKKLYRACDGVLDSWDYTNTEREYQRYHVSIVSVLNRLLEHHHSAKLISRPSDLNNLKSTLFQWVKNTYGHHFEGGFFKTDDNEDDAYLKQLGANENERGYISIIGQKLCHTKKDRLSFYNQLSNLKTTAPEGFVLFLEQLSHLAPYYPVDISPVIKMNDILCEKRSYFLFNQFSTRCLFEQKSTTDLFGKLNFFITQVEALLTSEKKMKPKFVYLHEFLASYVLNFPAISDEREQKNLLDNIHRIIKEIDDILLENRHIEKHLMACLNQLHATTSSESYPHTVDLLLKTVRKLREVILSGSSIAENQILLYSILSHFHENPQMLIALNGILESKRDEDFKRLFIEYLANLMDNGDAIDGYQALFDMLQGENIAKFKQVVESPPFPSMAQLKSWFENSQTFESYYHAFDTYTGERVLENAFNHLKYQELKSEFRFINQEIEEKTIFTDELGEKLNKQLILLRFIPTSELKSEIKKIVAQNMQVTSEPEPFPLICYLIELLARNNKDYDPDKKRLIRQEVNTPQVMLLYAALKTKNDKHIAQIETGEGKSRIIAIMNLYRTLYGKTVVCLNKNMDLAKRDYREYKQFALSVGVKSTITGQDFPSEMFLTKGINFTDRTQLPNLCSKAEIIDRDNKKYRDKPENYCLHVDECDQFFHDFAADACNLSVRDPKKIDLVWIYPEIYEFNWSRTETSKELVQPFRDYLLKKEAANPSRCARLSELDDEFIEVLLSSAAYAKKMESGKDYLISESVQPEINAQGQCCYSKRILVLDNGVIAEGATFKNGLQQMLSYKENLLILPESKVKRTRYPIPFSRMFGQIFGVSGTARSEYAAVNRELNQHGFDYTVVPRNKPSIREDKPPLGAKDEAQQKAFIKNEILRMMKEERAVMLFCKNDYEARLFYTLLSGDDDIKKCASNGVQYFDATTKDIDPIIKKAGEKQTLTITTIGRGGRGIHVHSSNLHGISTSIPSPEQEQQIKGRSGRYGQKGSYRMILNLADYDFDKTRMFNLESKIKSHQADMAAQQINTEMLINTYTQFSEEVTKAFLEQYWIEENHAEMLEKWSKFLEEMQLDWTLNTYPKMKESDQSEEKLFNIFSAFTHKWRDKMMADLNIKLLVNDNESKRMTKKVHDNKHSMFYLKQKTNPNSRVQHVADVSDAGQARIYDRLFPQTEAWWRGERRWFEDYHAWREGRGSLFPNWEAIWKGERPLFATLIATINRLIKEWSDYFKRTDEKVAKNEIQPVEINKLQIAVEINSQHLVAIFSSQSSQEEKTQALKLAEEKGCDEIVKILTASLEDDAKPESDGPKF